MTVTEPSAYFELRPLFPLPQAPSRLRNCSSTGSLIRSSDLLQDILISSAMSLASSSTSPPTTPPRLGKGNRPPSSPLRPNSPGAPSPTPTPPPANVPDSLTSPKNRPGSLPSASGSHLERSKSSKTRARDLLRKHYGLGAGPPPPSGRPMDPMDLGIFPLHLPLCV